MYGLNMKWVESRPVPGLHYESNELSGFVITSCTLTEEGQSIANAQLATYSFIHKEIIFAFG
jgi:hypothetical protein